MKGQDNICTLERIAKDRKGGIKAGTWHDVGSYNECAKMTVMVHECHECSKGVPNWSTDNTLIWYAYVWYL